METLKLGQRIRVRKFKSSDGEPINGRLTRHIGKPGVVIGILSSKFYTSNYAIAMDSDPNVKQYAYSDEIDPVQTIKAFAFKYGTKVSWHTEEKAPDAIGQRAPEFDFEKEVENPTVVTDLHPDFGTDKDVSF